MSCSSSFATCIHYESQRGCCCCCAHKLFDSSEQFEAYLDYDLEDTQNANCCVYHCFTWLYIFYSLLCCCRCNLGLFAHRIWGRPTRLSADDDYYYNGQTRWTQTREGCCCFLTKRHKDYLEALEVHPHVEDEVVMGLMRTENEIFHRDFQSHLAAIVDTSGRRYEELPAEEEAQFTNAQFPNARMVPVANDRDNLSG